MIIMMVLGGINFDPKDPEAKKSPLPDIFFSSVQQPLKDLHTPCTDISLTSGVQLNSVGSAGENSEVGLRG